MRSVQIFSLVFFVSVLMGSWAWAAVEERTEDRLAQEEAGQGTSSPNWIDFSNKHAPPIVALLVNFVLLSFIVYFVLRKPLGARFKNRKETLERAIEEAREMKDRAEKTMLEARARIGAMDSEMDSVRRRILEAGEAESTHILEDAKEQSTRLRADAKSMVEQEISQMAEGIRRQIAEEVVAMAERLVREKIVSADHDRLTREYLEGMNELKES
jgi:F-type H+-transporting ATPase subunit b